MIHRFFIIAFIIFFIGCASIPEKLVFSENELERKEAFSSIEKISLEEAQYIARDLKEIFLETKEKQKIRAGYSLIKIALIMAKNDYSAEALDYSNFVLSYGLIDSYGLNTDSFSRQITPYFLSNMAFILSFTAGQRKTKNWKTLSDFFIKYQDKYNIKISEKNLYLIKEAIATNLFDNAFKDGNIQALYDIINYYKNTFTYKLAEKIIILVKNEMKKNKQTDTKNILLNNNTIYNFYKESIIKLDNFINETSANIIKDDLQRIKYGTK